MSFLKGMGYIENIGNYHMPNLILKIPENP